MKRFAWVQVAVQALAIDGKGGHDEPRKGKKRNEVYIKEEVPVFTPIWAEHARIKSEADLKSTAAIEVLFNNSAPSREPPTVPRMVTSDELEERATIRSVTNPLAQRRRSTLAIRPTPKEGASIGEDYNLAAVQNVSDGYFQDPRSLKRRNESTSTIFQNSLLAPITIIVTTPEENEPPPSPPLEPRNSFKSIRASRAGSPNASTTSLPATRFSQRFSTDSLPLPQPTRLDPNRLMPPPKYQIDTQRLQKAQEFREIRKFLIHFMNAKGDQFPKKLRSRMMEAYAITDSDLAPEVVARFNDQGDIKDEGVALEQLGMNELDKETTDAEDLRILSMAFQSQMPVVTPSRDDGIPPYLSKNPRTRGPSLSIAKPPSPPSKAPRPPPPARTATAPLPLPSPPLKEKRMSTMTPKREEKEDEPLTWLGPLISTSTTASSENWPLPLSSQSRLQKAQSQPNMSWRAHGSAPPMPSLPNRRGRGDSLAGRGDGMEKALHVARVKRQGIIAGAFGAVREAIGGKKAGISGERRRLMLEGR